MLANAGGWRGGLLLRQLRRSCPNSRTSASSFLRLLCMHPACTTTCRRFPWHRRPNESTKGQHHLWQDGKAARAAPQLRTLCGCCPGSGSSRLWQALPGAGDSNLQRPCPLTAGALGHQLSAQIPNMRAGRWVGHARRSLFTSDSLRLPASTRCFRWRS